VQGPRTAPAQTQKHFVQGPSADALKPEAFDPKENYVIESVNANGKYLNVEGNSKDNGANVQLWESQWQSHWRLRQTAEGVYTVENTNAKGRYLNVRENGKENGANVHSWAFPFEWRFHQVSAGIYVIESISAHGKYLNVGGDLKNNGANVHLWDNPERAATQWRIKKVIPSVTNSPVLEWYTYRAVNDKAFEDYPFGDINTGNPEGVMWYLTNEVVNLYEPGKVRCPRKFDISKIMRFKITSRATNEMLDTGMTFGARFAYDQGLCEGRCFDGNKCTTEKDCKQQYSSYGYIVGCNNFWDHSAYPDYDTSAQNGVWYTFPMGGRCSASAIGYPTGEHNCTWTYQLAGEITLAEFEDSTPAPEGQGNCCNGRCSFVYDGDFMDTGATAQRGQKLEAMFAQKYPEAPQLGTPPCDFQAWKWYNPDNWERTDGKL